MKILITGSHFTPALAVIEELEKISEIEILYVGRKTTREGDKTASTESLVLPKLGIKYFTITAGRIQRSFSVYTVPSLLKIPIGIIQAFMIVLTQKPDVILSFGGYVSFPIVLSGWLLSVPVIIHEQTLIPSLANRIAAIFAQKIAVSFNHDYPYSRAKLIFTGNPIRGELLEGTGESSKKIRDFLERKIKQSPLIYITGGNQGSHIINETVESVLEKLSKDSFIVHQTGDSKYKDYERITSIVEKLNLSEKVLVYKWINTPDLRLILKRADLVISRSGINTLLELTYFNVPALVIPYPFLYKDEQKINARFFEKYGLIKVLLQPELTSSKLLDKVQEMLKRREKEGNLSDINNELIIKDAAKRLSAETISLARKG